MKKKNSGATPPKQLIVPPIGENAPRKKLLVPTPPKQAKPATAKPESQKKPSTKKATTTAKKKQPAKKRPASKPVDRKPSTKTAKPPAKKRVAKGPGKPPAKKQPANPKTRKPAPKPKAQAKVNEPTHPGLSGVTEKTTTYLDLAIKKQLNEKGISFTDACNLALSEKYMTPTTTPASVEIQISPIQAFDELIGRIVRLFNRYEGTGQVVTENHVLKEIQVHRDTGCIRRKKVPGSGPGPFQRLFIRRVYMDRFGENEHPAAKLAKPPARLIEASNENQPRRLTAEERSSGGFGAALLDPTEAIQVDVD